MSFKTTAWANHGAMTLFVLLWGSAAIFTRWGLDHGSPQALLVLRFAIALAALLVLGLWRRRCLPVPGTRLGVAGTGLLMIGSYSICYFQAMAWGVTPGVLATLLGVQPILTLVLLERRLSPLRLGGLVLALGGLVLVVHNSLVAARFSTEGMGFALGALACMTAGAIRQKRIGQAPSDVLPLQYAVSLLLCLAVAPFQPFEVSAGIGFLVPLLWLGLVISVLAQLLLYRLIRSGDLVDVTSLFYLVPAVTVVLDYLVLGNALPVRSLLGMAAILAGLVLVFRRPASAGR
jgi:drug/metabolite transporter (DMT)-like permease